MSRSIRRMGHWHVSTRLNDLAEINCCRLFLSCRVADRLECASGKIARVAVSLPFRYLSVDAPSAPSVPPPPINYKVVCALLFLLTLLSVPADAAAVIIAVHQIRFD